MAAAIFVALVVATALTAAIYKPGDWYETLDKPGWTPPNRAFPVVWAALYGLIAWAGWLVWIEAGFGIPLALWTAQLAFNAKWSWLFFGLRRMDYAFIDVCMLFVTVVAFIAAALPVSPLAAALFLPYAAWVALAATLNFVVWRRNIGQVATVG